MIRKSLKSSLILSVIAFNGEIMTIQAMENNHCHRYEIHSLSELSPENFEKITHYQMTPETLVGFNVNGTLTKTDPRIREFDYELIEFWNDDQKMMDKFGRIFKTQKEALEFYRPRVARKLEELGIPCRVNVREESTAQTLDLINATGATTLCITQREGIFENFTNEASRYGLKFTMQDKVRKKLADGINHKLVVSNDVVDQYIRPGKHAERNHREICLSYEDNVLYTGWRRIKGLSLKHLLQEADLLPDEKQDNFSKGVFKRFIFVDDKDKGFPEMEKVLTPHFDQIFFFFLKP